MKAKILIDDKLGRFKKGEIGTCEPSNYSKYDYLVTFEPVDADDDSLPMFLKGIGRMTRAFYFYSHEVEIIEG